MADYVLLSASVLLFALGILKARNTRPTPAKIFLLCALTFLFFALYILYIVSFYFTGKLFDESVLYHLYYGVDGAGFGDYLDIIAGSFVFLIAGLAGSYFIFSNGKGLHETHATRWNNPLSYSFILTAILLIPGNAYFLDVLLTERKSDFYDYYQSPGITKRPGAKRNVVVIYAEGLERTFFDETIFPKLIKNLRALEERSTVFTNLREVWGTKWTVAGMVASQCGIPLATPSHGNSMSGMDNFLKGAVCIGDLLSDEGYYLSYLGGSSLRFAGKGKFYSTHSFNEVRGSTALTPLLADPKYMGPWGLHDDSLFDIAFEEYEKLSREGDPFGLFMLTLDTHPPKGTSSESCNDIIYQEGINPILNSIACTDYLIGRFVNSILDSDYAENTIIVVASDHLSMRNTAYDLLEDADRTNLLMIIDPRETVSRKVAKMGSTLDVGPVILNALGYSGSIGLGRDILAGDVSLSESPVEFSKTLIGWKDSLMRFWEFPKLEGNVVVDGTYRTVIINGRTIRAPSLVIFNDKLETQLMFQFNNSPKHKRLTDHVLGLDKNASFIWIDDCRTIKSIKRSYGLCVVMGKLGSKKLRTYEVDKSTIVTMDAIRKVVISETSDEYYGINRLRLGF